MPEPVPDIRKVNVCRYVMPLREGGSLPAIAEADDGFLYALKFRGAGQGVKSLVAEYLGGEVARAIGLRVPEIVFANLNEGFGRTEPDEEIQDLLKASTGLNLGLHYLSGATTFDAAAFEVDPMTASKVLWLDAFIFNVDRTARNTNMLIWQKELWLIDHGASLYFHHAWANSLDYITRPFAQIADHVLLPFASRLYEADEEIKGILDADFFVNLCDSIPDEFLAYPDVVESAAEIREVYASFFVNRFGNTSVFVNPAKSAHESII